ncbi:DNA-directed RNA polymerase subunit beta, partial [Candidatus Arthromitus sp. SFB-2]
CFSSILHQRMGARKGNADTALKTADSGYLTRRLVDVSQDVIIRSEDCGSVDGIYVSEIKDDNSIVESLSERLIGRYVAEDIIDPKSNRILIKRDQYITNSMAKIIADINEDTDREESEKILKVKIRSVFTCDSRIGVCAKCYGMNMATAREISIGESVGIIAAQSIGEPGTQLTMRTFHTGGVVGADITQGLPRVEELFEARKPKGLAIVSEIDGIVEFENTKKKRLVKIVSNEGEFREYDIPFGSRVKVENGMRIEAGSIITEGSINPQDILRIKGIDAVREYLLSEVQKVYRLQGVDINDKHLEVIIKQMTRKVRVVEAGDTEILPNSIVDISYFNDENKRVKDDGLNEAECERVLLGITKASLSTESFLSAASFQETTKVLTDAAIKGKIDPLIGLKENVIIGKLIPAGTGMNHYRSMKINYGNDDNLEYTMV